jgi:signal transduction histidine kinase
MRFRVVSHGGRLDLHSQPGRGTTIDVRLPQRIEPAPGAAALTQAG